MNREKKMVVILLVGILCLGTAFCDDPKQEQQVPDPFENTSVLVEAFVVRVSNEALAKGDVNPIGQSPEGISILKILWCLKDEDKAQVISGAKLTVRHNGQAQSKNKDTFYIKRESPAGPVSPQGTPPPLKNVHIDAYDSGKQFEIQSRIIPDNMVDLEYSYSESGVNKNEDAETPPEQFSYDWKGNLNVQSGKPVIAGAIQSRDNTIFLILTATIQNSQDAEKDRQN